MNTQSLEFWRERIKEHGSIEGGMAINFFWNVIDPIHEEYISKYIKLSDRVLDAGCAYGRSAGYFSDKKYVGVDLVPEFINEARRRYPNKYFVIADLAELPFDDGEFDWALLISIKRVVQADSEDKWQKVLKELKRVSRHILFLEYGKSIPEEIHAAVEIL
ncbi:MAG: class I SAM-dependent methyltransferase [Patescibacteria group bacterium]